MKVIFYPELGSNFTHFLDEDGLGTKSLDTISTRIRQLLDVSVT